MAGPLPSRPPRRNASILLARVLPKDYQGHEDVNFIHFEAFICSTSSGSMKARSHPRG
jgi:hypothetical protein